ncbi:MAG: ATP-binding protein [Acidimicrobiales bacterium]
MKANSPAGPGPDGETTSGGPTWQTRDALATDRPWRDRVFWGLQVAVIGIFAARLGIEKAVTGNTVPGGPDFTTIALFIWPVLYAAVAFGATGASFTTALVAALSVSRLVAFANSSNTAGVWSESIQLVILCAIALVVGRRVASERVARLQADEARREHLAAEARYRGLFTTNSAPVLIVDGSGSIVEANPAALTLFGDHGADQSGKKLADLLGRDVVRRLLELPRRAAQQSEDIGSSTGADDTRVGADQGDSESTDGETSGWPASAPADGASEDGPVRSVVVRVSVAGTPMLYRTDATWLTYAAGQQLVQLVLHDVTIETLRQEWMEAYAARVLNAQEEERRHIAQELHDGPLQALVYLCRRIDEVGSRAAREEHAETLNGSDGARTDVAAELEELRHLAESLIGEIRGISRGLRPSVLDDLGLVAATRRLLDDLEQRTGIDTTLGITGNERRLPTPIELALFRVAQEAISNAELHAGPGRVAVGMSFEPNGVRLLVSDDGEGFEQHEGAASAGRGSLGLVGMRERLHLVGGRVEVHSSPGRGTTVDAWASTRDN